MFKIVLPTLAWITVGAAPPMPDIPGITILNAPAVDRVGGETIIRYELTFTNAGDRDMILESLRISDSNGQEIELFDSAKLKAMMSNELTAGKLATLYLDLDIGDKKVPKRLDHEISYRVENDAPSMIKKTTIVDNVEPVIIGAPLGTGHWIAVHNADWTRGHRRMTYTVNGKARIPGRFAIDWVGVNSDGKISIGNPDLAQDAVGYGAPILAVASARVVAMRNDMTELASIAANGAHGTESAAGNYIVLDLGGNRFAFYEHLKPGSVNVRVGDNVRKGQVIGALGFTGDSTGPHLHFHVADNPHSLGSEGLPFLIDRFQACGEYRDLTKIGSAKWDQYSQRRKFRKQRPEGGEVVSFGPMGCKK